MLRLSFHSTIITLLKDGNAGSIHQHFNLKIYNEIENFKRKIGAQFQALYHKWNIELLLILAYIRYRIDELEIKRMEELN